MTGQTPSRPSRIAVVTSSYPAYEDDPSGHFVRAEVRALLARGHDVEVFVPRGAAFGWPGVIPRLREKPARLFGVARALAKTRRDLFARPCWDRVIAHWLPTAWMAHGLPSPLEVVLHGTDVRLLRALPRLVREHTTRVLATHASQIRAVSEVVSRDLLACAAPSARRALSGKLVIAPSPVEWPDVSARQRELSARYATRRLAVTVGRLIPEKNVDRVLEHVASSRADVALVIVGDGPEREKLERLARSLSVHARFVGLVERAEALAWIGAADVLLHASRAEGNSTVLREARALGTLVEVVS